MFSSLGNPMSKRLLRPLVFSVSAQREPTANNGKNAESGECRTCVHLTAEAVRPRFRLTSFFSHSFFLEAGRSRGGGRVPECSDLFQFRHRPSAREQCHDKMDCPVFQAKGNPRALSLCSGLECPHQSLRAKLSLPDGPPPPPPPHPPPFLNEVRCGIAEMWRLSAVCAAPRADVMDRVVAEDRIVRVAAPGCRARTNSRG